MDLEVEVIGRRDRLAGIPDEANDLPRANPNSVHHPRRVAGQVRVVVGGPRRITKPQAIAAESVDSNAVDLTICHGEDRSALRRKDVRTVMPPGSGTRCSVSVRIACGGSKDREYAPGTGCRENRRVQRRSRREGARQLLGEGCRASDDKQCESQEYRCRMAKASHA